MEFFNKLKCINHSFVYLLWISKLCFMLSSFSLFVLSAPSTTWTFSASFFTISSLSFTYDFVVTCIVALVPLVHVNNVVIYDILFVVTSSISMRKIYFPFLLIFRWNLLNVIDSWFRQKLSFWAPGFFSHSNWYECYLYDNKHQHHTLCLQLVPLLFLNFIPWVFLKMKTLYLYDSKMKKTHQLTSPFWK